MTVVACLVSNWKCRLNSRLFLRQRTHTMRKKFSTNLAPLNATYASVRLFIRNVNTNSSHFIINKNNTVWHAVSSRFKPDNELTSSVFLERKDVLFKTQSWVLYHDKVRFTHLVTLFMKEFSIYWCCISRENGGKNFVKIYVCFTTYKDSFTAMIFCVHSYDFIGIINEFLKSVC